MVPASRLCCVYLLQQQHSTRSLHARYLQLAAVKLTSKKYLRHKAKERVLFIGEDLESFTKESPLQFIDSRTFSTSILGASGVF